MPDTPHSNTTPLAYQDYPQEPIMLDNLSTHFMKESLFVPISLADDTLTVAIADPDNFYAVDTLKLAYQYKVRTFPGRPEDIIDAIDRLYGTGTESMDMIIEEAGRNIEELAAHEDENADHLRDMASEAPIIRLVNRLILNAIEQRASDIHFEPFEGLFKVRYRIDGVLHEVESPPVRLQAAIISRVKIMAKLDIAERRLPQDGRIKLLISNREIDFRISTLPTMFGESLVMRILDRENLVLDFHKIGFPDDILQGYLGLIRQPYGMILVTGPTGSGKTSTLYATLARVNSPEIKIITLEDPVEYQLRGVNQIQVNTKIGLNFASGLRSIVRQDPDIILVGEIRDHETAEIAIQSALTGHLLFSTLHTNDAVGAITRLLDMKVESFLLSSTLLGVLAQRLVRVICPVCKQEVTNEDNLMRSLRAETPELADAVFYVGAGCEACRNTGYQGRIAIFEFMRIDDDIRREIVKQSGTETLRRMALDKGLVTLRQDGWRKVLAGITTVAEVLKVTLDN
ncbi:type II secretion system ATPase GspE [Desulfatitalea alkaliphila]|uniref:protein-secreting ATPase n=1 Tax=Desulfatitalea alkaliphila TaxID=2929485 RepID=A0AA41QZU5_9BACT|nr:type II secretion system ATPase GspE [Desulfatitalea alkaliphila]MCJ8499369.1 type II secretion system ATPase GspE [Desulfatitalea alkaliphila]